MPKDAVVNIVAPGGTGPMGALRSGIGDADQASPLGSGRSRPRV